MASGFDTRQGARTSFASEGPAITQIGGRVQTGGVHRDAQVVGGGAVAGGAPNAQITGPGNLTANLGKWVGEIVQPYVERRSQEKFVEGLTRRQAGESMDELAKSHKGVVGALFGPSSLEQGATFYESVRVVDQWDLDMNNRMDELIKLPPEEQAKEISKSWQGLLGDNPYVNQLVSKQMIEKVGPRLDLINKARYGWLQDKARKGMYDALDTSASSFQSVMAGLAKVTDPTDEETAGAEVARNNFLGLMARPEGMSDETYKETLTASMDSFARNGNWFAYHALEEAGVMDVLDDEQRAKIEKAYDRYEAKTLTDAKGNHIEAMLRIHEKELKAGLGLTTYSALEKVADVDAVNAQISRETGLRKRAYDSGTLLSEGKSILDMMAANARRDEERAYQERRDIAKEEREEARKEREEGEKYSAASTALKMGTPRSGLASGMDASAMKQAYFNTYSSGDFKTLGAAFDREHYFDNDVAKLMQSKIVSAGGVTFTGETQKGYAEWEALYKVSPGAAAFAYADLHPKLLFMQRLVKGNVAPEQAYQRAFGDPANRPPPARLDPTARKETAAAVADVVDKQGTSWFSWQLGFGQRPMGDQAKRVLTGVITTDSSRIQGNSDLSPAAATKQAAQAAKASGAFEFYGGNMAWRGNGKEKSAATIVGVTERAFGDLLANQIDESFKSTGRKAGADMEFEIFRTPAGEGKFVLTVHPTDPGDGPPIIIHSDELKARNAKGVRGELTGNQPKPHGRKYNGVNPYRRVPGETGWQRTQRINREVAAGADPVNHMNN